MPSTPPPDEAVLGLDNVRLDLPVAGAATRALAGALDYLIVTVVTVAWVAGSVTLAALADFGGGWTIAVMIVGIFVIQSGYFAACELAMAGQTVGKKALGLRVVARDGARAGTAAILVRNLVRTIDVLIGVPMMMADSLSRRLGDRLAGTLVVHTEAGGREIVIRRVPRGWTGAHVATAEEFLRRQADLERPRAEAMARQLLAAIRRDDPSLVEGEVTGDPVGALRRALDAGP